MLSTRAFRGVTVFNDAGDLLVENGKVTQGLTGIVLDFESKAGWHIQTMYRVDPETGLKLFCTFDRVFKTFNTLCQSVFLTFHLFPLPAVDELQRLGNAHYHKSSIYETLMHGGSLPVEVGSLNLTETMATEAAGYNKLWRSMVFRCLDQLRCPHDIDKTEAFLREFCGVIGRYVTEDCFEFQGAPASFHDSGHYDSMVLDIQSRMKTKKNALLALLAPSIPVIKPNAQCLTSDVAGIVQTTTSWCRRALSKHYITHSKDVKRAVDGMPGKAQVAETGAVIKKIVNAMSGVFVSSCRRVVYLKREDGTDELLDDRRVSNLSRALEAPHEEEEPKADDRGLYSAALQRGTMALGCKVEMIGIVNEYFEGQPLHSFCHQCCGSYDRTCCDLCPVVPRVTIVRDRTPTTADRVAVAGRDVYKYKDWDGVVHVSHASPENAGEVVEKILGRLEHQRRGLLVKMTAPIKPYSWLLLCKDKYIREATKDVEFLDSKTFFFESPTFVHLRYLLEYFDADHRPQFGLDGRYYTDSLKDATVLRKNFPHCRVHQASGRVKRKLDGDESVADWRRYQETLCIKAICRGKQGSPIYEPADAITSNYSSKRMKCVADTFKDAYVEGGAAQSLSLRLVMKCTRDHTVSGIPVAVPGISLSDPSGDGVEVREGPVLSPVVLSVREKDLVLQSTRGYGDRAVRLKKEDVAEDRFIYRRLYKQEEDGENGLVIWERVNVKTALEHE